MVRKKRRRRRVASADLWTVEYEAKAVPISFRDACIPRLFDGIHKKYNLVRLQKIHFIEDRLYSRSKMVGLLHFPK